MTYQEIEQKMQELIDMGIDYEIIGTSLLGRNIYAFHVGNYGPNQMIVEGSIHAREYVAGLAVVEQIKYTNKVGVSEGGIYFIPFANPDGVALVLEGIDSVVCPKLHNYILVINNNSYDFSQWKANAYGVDLNVNFDALWGGGAQNVFCPSPANFVGYFPNSEKEVLILISFTEKVSPIVTLSYHTKGEVIYYGFETLSQKLIARDRQIAEYIQSINGYVPIKTENSTGGYSDWVSQELEVAAFTIEVGSYLLPTPLPVTILDEIALKNNSVPTKTLQYVISYNKNSQQ